MKAFIHNGKTYLRVIPAKFMMRSTMLYEITTRGDILGLDIETQVMSVFKGTDPVEHIDLIASRKSILSRAAKIQETTKQMMLNGV